MPNDSSIFSKLSIHFVFMILLVAAVVTPNFLGLKVPNDGVYYVALADSMINSGIQTNLITFPPTAITTHQNGIVFIIIVLKLALSSSWWLGYIICVAFIWAITARYLFVFFYNQIGHIYLKKSTLLPLILCYIPIIHYTTLSAISNFFNEAIIIPICWFLFAFYSNNFTEFKHGRHNDLTLPRKVLLKIGFLVGFFLIFGMFFRIQILTFIVAFAVTFKIFRILSIKSVIGIISVSLLIFFTFINYDISPAWMNFLTQSTAISGAILYDKVWVFLSLMASPLSMISFDTPIEALHHYYINDAVSVVASFLVFYGLIVMRRTHVSVYVLSALLLFLNVIFILFLPINSGRFELPVLILILTIYLYALSGVSSFISLRLITWGAALVSCVLLTFIPIYTSKYFNSDTSRNTYNRIQITNELNRMIPEIGEFVVYSQFSRITYWVTGLPSCVVEPAECTKLQDLPNNSSILFIGNESDFLLNTNLAKYTFSDQLSDEQHKFGVWLLEPRV